MTLPHGPMQWTPGGLVPLSTGTVVPGGIQAASIFIAHDEDDDEDDSSSPTHARRSASRPAKTPTPRGIVAQARQRLRDVNAELRRMKALEKERDQLKRLIDAADNKPRAIVREIKRSAG